jgi:dTDP-4-dehydrorhamnose reductase
MIKILVTGSNGQLGSEIQSLAPIQSEMEFLFTDIEELDITNANDIDNFFSKNEFNVLLNCASFTAVDKAESEPDTAMKVNGEAIQHLAIACMKYHCYPIHLSTDYVFCGSHHKPYSEEDIPDPASIYGQSKLKGEQYFYDIAKKGMIIRTSWMYSPHGENFVKTILKNGKEMNELKVVSDQVGSPTYARDLAQTILSILPRALAENRYGIYHYSNEGVCSWYDLALETVKIAGFDCEVKPVKTSEYPTKAPRPYYSVLDKDKIKREFGITIPHWKDGLQRCIEAMNIDR